MTDRPTAADFNEELSRTAYQKKAVSRLPANEVLDLAVAFFKERGYRAGRTGRPNHVFVMGGREGILPRVNGEVSARADVGKAGTTLVTMDAAGERLGPAMAEFHKYLRAQRLQGTSTPERS
ncbi:MAG TPA: hypothetical protein VFL82_08825 [Thermomicrobiales bacterium]|jgi:hypothetical protein|nr:hypothetical protein [Thermomicrobiales bacterium]